MSETPNIAAPHVSAPGDAAPDLAALKARYPSAFGPSTGQYIMRGTGGVLVLAWLIALFWWFDITPARLSHGLSGLFVILRQMVPPSPGAQAADILQGLAESVAMAFLGTTVAAVLALPLGFLGARNVVVNVLAHFSVRRVFDGFRGVDQLIWALAFVRAVGLGPLAGVLAITAAEIFVLAKQFAEAIENADPRQPEAITAVGGSRLAVIRFGLLPQVLPVLLAQVLYSFESNTRSAAILGVVGAGGIGLQIAERIKVRYWNEVSFIIILILVTVAVIDFLSARVRRKLIG
jgi:phosphonate transport system permease protein